MADAEGHARNNEETITPTAIHLQEERFPQEIPSFNTTPPNEQSRQDGTCDSSAPPHLSRTGTDFTVQTRPTTLQKSATGGAIPSGKGSWLGRKRTHTVGKMPQLGRQATLTFNPYSSDESSDSDDEGPHKDGHDGTAGTEESQAQGDTRKRKRENAGFSGFKIVNDHFKTKGKVSKSDGRLKLSINETINSGYFAKTLGAGLKKHFGAHDANDRNEPLSGNDAQSVKISPEEDEMEHDPDRRIQLNICVIVIGSRGDIQPFLKIGKILKEDYGHRVRIATHPAFKKFVEEDSGLEFFSVGGDPSELMAFMVKNPGLIPSVDTLKKGEVGRRRAAMYNMFQGMWRACVNSTDDESDKANMKLLGDKQPFVADAIIANPPSFAPPHIAERLGIPLHMMFTFPYTPTSQFPHPLANIKASNVDANYTNFMSYPLVEMMTWQGLGDLINRFRVKTLCLEEVSTLWAPGQLYRLKVPYTYMWSPSLVPKPKDWGPEIDIAGFVFLELASTFKPPESLTKFLDDGPPPVYIGFGSIVVDDPDKFTELIFEAVQMAGVRALVSKGWGGLGDKDNTPENIYMLENTPHDWLFPRVSAVVHHGGAGTTAIGLKCAKPTMIVPFFGDQPFWGAMVAKAKAGAHECIPYKKLTAERLAEGIKQCLTAEAKKNVQDIADNIAKEGDGAANAVRSFHRSLPLHGERSMRCQMLDNKCAAWTLKKTNVHLSPLAAELLVEQGKVKWNELRLLRHYEWNDFGGPGEPLTGVWGAILGTVTDMATGMGEVPVKMLKSVKDHEQYWEKKRSVKKRQKHARRSPTIANNHTPDDIAKHDLHKKGETNARPAAANRHESSLSTLSEPEEALAQELAEEAAHGFKKTTYAIIKAPMDLTLVLAQGFHNAPRLYGDETVRRPPRVTGFRSGIRAGRDELLYGIYDGVTGLVMQPYRGAKNHGPIGLVYGFGMGIGGFVLKDIAAFLGPGAYAMKGLHEEALKKHQPTNFLRRARIMQGQVELSELGSRVQRKKAKGDSDSTLAESAKRQEVEMQVLRRWEWVQQQVQEERRQHRTGFRASLPGMKKKKEDTAIPRKETNIAIPNGSTDGTANSMANGQPRKTTSTPINEGKKANVGTKGRDRGTTAPDDMLKWKSKRPDNIGPIPTALKEEAKQHGVGKNEIPSVFGASLQGNGRPISNTISRSLSQQSEKGRQRVASDATDWVAVRSTAQKEE